MSRLSAAPAVEVGAALLDVDRLRRKDGFPEVVYAPGKSPEDVLAALLRLVGEGQPALATRVDPTQRALLIDNFGTDARFDEISRVFWANPPSEENADLPWSAPVGIVTAGLTDRPVAEEAAVILEAVGIPCVRLSDVGVAGLHRLLSRIQRLEPCEVVIVAAGMDGALPSVVAGLVPQPVIALPTSVGYGAALGGVGPLLAMLSSCAPGLACVNIDGGYSAAAMAFAICARVRKAKHAR